MPTATQRMEEEEEEEEHIIFGSPDEVAGLMSKQSWRGLREADRDELLTCRRYGVRESSA